MVASLRSTTRAPRRGQRRGQHGQGLVEYALIILFVAIAVVAILALLGPVIGSIFSQIAPAL